MKKFKPKRRYATFICSLAATWSMPALADGAIEAVPTNWRIENYVGNQGLVAWFTGSSCTNGMLTFPESATIDDKNRFFSLVLSAKLSGRVIGVYYETASASCRINSFFMQN